ncbi:MAG: hypothetical protein Ta2G_05630 [Termitinemataceae bacterium]|nr:MAG: hypothetical protein Ta2G_05630 [Termitinemataceae bacterium]
MKKFFGICILFFVLSHCLFAQEDTRGAEKRRGDYLTIKTAVIGPGDDLYFWWGHFGLVIDDALRGSSTFYDYGVFSFNKENFFSNFAFGRLYYTSAVSRTDRDIAYYSQDNRDITFYTLDFDAAEKELILREAEFYSMKENAEYLYNHFKDNCVTRVLNPIDKALNGELYRYTNSTPGRMTLREHVRRHTYFSPFFDWFLNFVMGQDIDTPSTITQEMFLPSEAASVLENFYYLDGGGNKRKLVSDVQVINRSVNRPPVLDKPRMEWPPFLIFGIAVGGILYLLRSRAESAKNKKLRGASKTLFGLLCGVLSLFFALAGSLAFFMAFFTNHDYSFHNMNVIFINPLLLIAFVPAFILAFSKNEEKNKRCEKIFRIVWTYVFFAAILCMLLKVLPFFYHKNYATLAMCLPISLSLSLIPYWIRKHE